MSNIVLASLSRTRGDMLKAAGINFHAIPPRVDEEALKQEWLAEDSGLHPRDLALRLARAKALSLSAAKEAVIIGADQTLSLKGALFNKAADEDELKDRLIKLRGKTHYLHSAVVCAQEGEIVFEHVDEAALTMRDVSDAFLDAYLAKASNAVLSSVGGYQLEGLGIQLFDKVEGNHFTVLGMPLMPLLAFLREAGELET